jgi:hypothetical protein
VLDDALNKLLARQLLGHHSDYTPRCGEFHHELRAAHERPAAVQKVFLFRP